MAPALLGAVGGVVCHTRGAPSTLAPALLGAVGGARTASPHIEPGLPVDKQPAPS
jgi:hypothetical protein